MITVERIDKAIQEAERFIEIAEKAKLRLQYDDENEKVYAGCRETGQAKRASLDLSQALVEFRR